MLSYQHIYHAGNLADVHKHASLSVLFDLLTKKDKPLSYIETHAGRGVYDLSSAESEKTKEAQFGIKQIKLPKDHVYTNLIKRIHEEIGEHVYPGSPFIAEALLRPTDVLHLMELHPTEYKYLYQYMRYPNTHLHHRDGFEGGLAICPPSPARGMIFIDPSYEVKTEYKTVGDFAVKLHKKWNVGIICIWYPILKENYHFELVEQLKTMNNFYKSEVYFSKPATALLGSGLAVINTPFGADEELNKIKKWNF